MVRLAILASGSGSNAENIIRYFADNTAISIAGVLTNNPAAGVIDRCKKLSVPCFTFSKEEMFSGELTEKLTALKTDYIILAGFLLLLPLSIIKKYPDRILNIHPALLPQHGGKGFYGSRVHEKVKSSGSVMSGITIHQVNEKYDEGRIIFQAACHIDVSDDAEKIAEKVHQLEYQYFPVVIEKYIRSVLGK